VSKVCHHTKLSPSVLIDIPYERSSKHHQSKFSTPKSSFFNGYCVFWLRGFQSREFRSLSLILRLSISLNPPPCSRGAILIPCFCPEVPFRLHQRPPPIDLHRHPTRHIHHISFPAMHTQTHPQVQPPQALTMQRITQKDIHKSHIQIRTLHLFPLHLSTPLLHHMSCLFFSPFSLVILGTSWDIQALLLQWQRELVGIQQPSVHLRGYTRACPLFPRYRCMASRTLHPLRYMRMVWAYCVQVSCGMSRRILTFIVNLPALLIPGRLLPWALMHTAGQGKRHVSGRIRRCTDLWMPTQPHYAFFRRRCCWRGMQRGACILSVRAVGNMWLIRDSIMVSRKQRKGSRGRRGMRVKLFGIGSYGEWGDWLALARIRT
jgi:hypothetical protein